MAQIKKGIIGGFKGSISQVVGYRQKSKSILRSKTQPTKSGKRKKLRTNGLNLAIICELYPHTLPIVESLLSSGRPDLEMSWNNSIKHLLGTPCFENEGLLTQISLGQNQFKDNLTALCATITGGSQINVKWDKTNNIRANYLLPRLYFVWFSDQYGSIFSNNVALNGSSDTISFSVSGLVSSGKFGVVSWIYDAWSDTYSQASVTTYRKP